MSIVLFALIGAYINAGVAYWICFSLFCIIKTISLICTIVEKANE